MLDNPAWILSFRNEYLTVFFKLFPFLASHYFYIIVIALGYWLSTRKILFVHLGFLLPFSTLLNSIIKALFKIPRPPEYLHLIPLDNSFGFPSGDVQVATVFWLYIFLTFRKYISLVPIILIAMSRVYLGVHSIYDVVFGFVFGLLTITIWNNKYIKIQYQRWYNGHQLSFWLLLCFSIVSYMLITLNIIWPKVVPVVIGALIGYGLSLKQISKDLAITPQNKLLPALLSLALLIIVAKFIPLPSATNYITYSLITIKYACIMLAIFMILPKVQYKLARLYNN